MRLTFKYKYLRIAIFLMFLFTGTLIHALAHPFIALEGHHHSSTAQHASLLCAWLCAAGQIAVGQPFVLSPANTPVAVVDTLVVPHPPYRRVSLARSRSPPPYATA